MLGEPEWNSKNSPNFVNFDRNSRKTIQNLAKFRNPQDSESAGFGILYKLLLPFLEILQFLGTQFSVVHRVWIFSGKAHYTTPIFSRFTSISSDLASHTPNILIGTLIIHPRHSHTLCNTVLGQNPPGQNPPDKIPRTKSPGQNPP